VPVTPINLAATSITSTGFRAGWAPWTPAELFSASQQGVWYEPSDLSTLFQDAAGTTPVTADGQPVGRMNDKSGNGNNLSQTTLNRRPLYKTDGVKHWLKFDGVNDFLFSSAINMTAYTSVFYAMSLNAVSPYASGANIIIEFGLGNGSFTTHLNRFGTDFTTYVQRISSNVLEMGYAKLTGAQVIASIVNFSAATAAEQVIMRENGIAKTLTNYDSAVLGSTGTVGNLPLYLGARSGASNPSNAEFFGLVIAPGAGNFQDAERYLSELNGNAI
jgi:hypothetical protein